MRKNTKDTIEFLEDYCRFGKNRVYVLLGVARKKYNPELSHNSEIVYRKVIKNKKDIKRKYRELCGMIDKTDKFFYTYITANARNTIKTAFNFNNRMNEWFKHMYFGDKNQIPKLKKIDSEWVSELQRPHNRDDNYFLFDIDSKQATRIKQFKNELYRLHLQQTTEVIVWRETKNGFHAVTKPFNFNKELDLDKYEDIDLETDNLLFLETRGDIDE